MAEEAAAERRNSALQSGDRIADKYEIEARIGEGGMGMIYAATNVLTGKRVAVKWMHPRFAEDEDAVNRFLREARAAGSIDHPNVVNIFDVGRHEGTPFLVMELLRGKPLDALLDAGPLPASELIDILVPAMRGIAAAHKMGIVHRDLKPENIFICMDAKGRRRDAKVLDFGISKAFDADTDLASVTKTGTIVGTPAYMSPEQIRGHKDIDHATDVYALGVILYLGLTGQLPFRAELFTALAVEIATGKVQPLREIVPSIDPELDEIVQRALSRDRRERFQDVASLARALERFGTVKFGEGLSDHPPPMDDERRDRETAETIQVAPPLPPVESPAPMSPVITSEISDAAVEPPPRSRGPLVIAAVSVAVVAIGIATLALWPDPEAPTPDPPAADEPATEEPEEPEAVAPAPIEPAHVEEAPAPVVAPEPPQEIPDALDPPEEPARPRRAQRSRTPRETTPAEAPREEARTPEPRERRRAEGRRTSGVSIDDF